MDGRPHRTKDPDPGHFSDGEVSETVARHFGYFKDGLVVVYWNAAVQVDKLRAAVESPRVFEIANFQLCELEACGRLFDNAMKSSDADAGRKRCYHRSVLRNLGEL